MSEAKKDVAVPLWAAKEMVKEIHTGVQQWTWIVRDGRLEPMLGRGWFPTDDADVITADDVLYDIPEEEDEDDPTFQFLFEASTPLEFLEYVYVHDGYVIVQDDEEVE